MKDWNRPYVPRVDAYRAPLWVRPAIRIGGGTIKSWPVSADPIDESGGGTFYTDWCTLDGGPSADGDFAVPNFATSGMYPGGSVSCWMQYGDSGAVVTGVLIGTCTSTSLFTDGSVSRIGEGDVLVSLTGGDLMGQVRWKVTGSAYLFWSLAGGTIRQL